MRAARGHQPEIQTLDLLYERVEHCIPHDFLAGGEHQLEMGAVDYVDPGPIVAMPMLRQRRQRHPERHTVEIRVRNILVHAIALEHADADAAPFLDVFSFREEIGASHLLAVENDWEWKEPCGVRDSAGDMIAVVSGKVMVTPA